MRPRKIKVAYRRRRVAVSARLRTLAVTLYLPLRVGPIEWQCAYRIAGHSATPISGRASGDAGIQALMLAHESVRLELNRIHRGLAWQAGFWRYAPEFYGERFSARLNRIIDRETLRYARAITARHKARYPEVHKAYKAWKKAASLKPTFP